ncbi:MAG: DMT family transporter [Siculibacillus sp.]|nr:DMT family transporter [Siculibacillus sp.]
MFEPKRSAGRCSRGDGFSHVTLLGPFYKIVSTLAFAFMLVAVKLLADRVPSGEVVFFRSAFAVFPVVAMVWWQGQLRDGLTTSRPGGHVMRSVYGVSAMSLWFAGVQRLPLADALAITYAAPLVVVALAAVMLGEVVRAHRWSAVAIGFVGVLIVLSPHLGDVERIGSDRGATGAVMCFLSAFFMALAQIEVRKLATTEKTGAIVVYFSIGSALFSLITLPFGWVMPNGTDLVLLISCGLFGGIGQIFLTMAYRHSDASVIAPLEYASMVWAVASGLWLFDEAPTSTLALGTVVIVASGVAIVWRERAIGRTPPPEV